MEKSSEEYIKIKKSELEELVDRKVEEKLNESRETFSGEEYQRISRRKFLKKVGAGAAGLGF